jgi:hypothetical protein
MWFDSVGGQLYIYFNDGNSLQWVIANNFNGGLYLPLQGVTDGSDAAAGQIGEYLFAQATTAVPSATAPVFVNVATLALTAGDWNVGGQIYAAPSATASIITGGVTNASASNPGTTQCLAMLQNGSTGNVAGAAPVRRFSVSAPTTAYLTAATSAGTANFYGSIWARRVR